MRVVRRARGVLAALVAAAVVVPTVFFVAGSAPQSGAMTMGPDHCALAHLAFCDTFQTIVGGGREGDLDPAKWSFTRVNQQNNPYQGQIDNYAPAVAQFCKTTKVVQPDHDSFICGAQFSESNHWMDAMNDNGQYVNNSNRIRQPFDFANRTGNIVFDVDAKTEGPHSFWNEVWITDLPVQGPHIDHPGTHSYPRNGVGFVFDADWCGGALQSANALREIDTFKNYVETITTVRSPCFTTQADSANHFQIKISKSHIEVWASNAGGMNFRRISSNNIPLSFTRGYVSFQHSQYNAAKFNSTNTMTYHWHAIGFDGPVIPPDRGYEVPDAMQRRPDGTVNLGYEVPTKAFALPGVNLTGVAKAYLTYSTWFFAAPKTMTATVNGVRTAPYSDPTNKASDVNGTNGYTWRYMVQPIPLGMLRQGTNTVSFNTPCGTDQCPTLANIDLELVRSTQASPIQLGRIQYDSPGVDTGSNASLNGEYFVVKNTGTVARDLVGFTVRDMQNHVYTFSSFDLGAGRSVIVHTGSGTNTATDRYWNLHSYIWDNVGDTALLRNATGLQIDSCGWTTDGVGYKIC